MFLAWMFLSQSWCPFHSTMLNSQERMSADTVPFLATQGGEHWQCISLNNWFPWEPPGSPSPLRAWHARLIFTAKMLYPRPPSLSSFFPNRVKANSMQLLWMGNESYIGMLQRGCVFSSRPPQYRKYRNKASQKNFWFPAVYKSYSHTTI